MKSRLPCCSSFTLHELAIGLVLSWTVHCAGLAGQVTQALVRFGVASPAAGAALLQLMTRHMLIAPLDTPQQLAAIAGMLADLADLAASDASTGKLPTAGKASLVRTSYITLLERL